MTEILRIETAWSESSPLLDPSVGRYDGLLSIAYMIHDPFGNDMLDFPITAYAPLCRPRRKTISHLFLDAFFVESMKSMISHEISMPSMIFMKDQYFQ